MGYMNAIDHVSRQGPFVLLVDLTDMAVMTPRAKDLAQKSMVYAQTHGQYQSVEVVPRTVVSLGVTETARMACNNDSRVVVKTLEAAERITEQLCQELRDQVAPSGSKNP